MLFTWSSENLCIVFRQWHITGTFSLIVSLFAIVLLAAGYEAIREVSRRYEQSHEARMSAFSSGASTEDAQLNESRSLLVVGRDSKATAERKGVIIKGALYAVQVFYSFFIMLLFMTYNGWVMLAVAQRAWLVIDLSTYHVDLYKVLAAFLCSTSRERGPAPDEES
ncbi:hypothetical protein B0A52_01707 [Exophiala mesophila]|uniref:Copper transport protein n=1 Tax=Exophiala mesophila TaxID=212818 RepID=A0A438NFT9_EXOME|nr:hypothetical protein B0A52_01707 [Exophiala mesophila]